jgi:glycosyltransferase involved in cell wall biosynthesis
MSASFRHASSANAQAASRARPRIALIIPALVPVGGLERLVLNQAEQFLARNVDVDFVFLNEPHDVSEILPPGSRAFNLGVQRLRAAVFPIARFLRQQRPAAVHAAMWPVTCLTVLAHRLAGVPSRLVLSDHNPLSLQYAERGALHRLVLRTSMALAYPLADARVAVSAAVADDLARLSGLPAGRFTVIHNPVPVGSDAVCDPTWAAQAWQGWKGKRIITVGRLKAQKNHSLLLRAFSRVRQRVDARLMILGVGELESRIRQEIDVAGLADEVLMPGHVADPMPYYRSADLFVLSSNYEGFGMVLIEALASGLPVVSTDCPGGPAEILQGGAYGRLVPVEDEHRLATAMIDALSEPRDAARLQRRARDFDAGALAGRYLSLLLPNHAGACCGTAPDLPLDPEKQQ